jgi:drug/metabolite transporter (DMT)-like permease
MALGIFFALLAALALGSGSVIARKAMFVVSVPVAFVVSLGVILAAIGSMAMIVEGPSAFIGLPLTFYLSITLLAVLGYVTGQFFHFTALSKTAVTIVAPIVAGNALFSLLFAVTLGGERPNAPTVLGAFIIVAGVVIILTDRNRVMR